MTKFRKNVIGAIMCLVMLLVGDYACRSGKGIL